MYRNKELPSKVDVNITKGTNEDALEVVQKQ